MDYGRIDINPNHQTMLYSQQFEKVPIQFQIRVVHIFVSGCTSL
jgi:hypothetical protein